MTLESQASKGKRRHQGLHRRERPSGSGALRTAEPGWGRGRERAPASSLSPVGGLLQPNNKTAGPTGKGAWGPDGQQARERTLVAAGRQGDVQVETTRGTASRPPGGGEQPQRDGGLGGRGGAGAPTCRRWGCEVVQTLQKGLGAPEPECHRVTQRSQFQARTQKRCPRAPRGRPSWAVDAARLHRHMGHRSAVETRSADTRACPGLGTRRAEEAGAAGGAPWGSAAGAGAADRWSPRPGAGGRNGATARERGARNVGLESREGCTTGGKCPHC